MNKLFKNGSGKKKNPAFNSKGNSMLATLLGLASLIFVVGTIVMLANIMSTVSDINAGKVADGRLGKNVAKYDDKAPKFKHAVKAPGFVGNLYGIADQANAFAVDPMDCYIGYATSININGDLGCSTDGAMLTGIQADTLQGHDSSYFQNAGTLNTGTLADSRLSSNVTLRGNGFNGANQLVSLDAKETAEQLLEWQKESEQN